MKDKVLFIAVDDPLLRVGLRVELESIGNFKVIGEAGNGDRTIAGIRSLQPHLAIIDADLPGVATEKLIKHLQQIAPKMKILLLTTFGQHLNKSNAIKPGSVSYLTKSTEKYMILKVIRSLLRDQKVPDFIQEPSTFYPF